MLKNKLFFFIRLQLALRLKISFFILLFQVSLAPIGISKYRHSYLIISTLSFPIEKFKLLFVKNSTYFFVFKAPFILKNLTTKLHQKSVKLVY